MSCRSILCVTHTSEIWSWVAMSLLGAATGFILGGTLMWFLEQCEVDTSSFSSIPSRSRRRQYMYGMTQLARINVFVVGMLLIFMGTFVWLHPAIAFFPVAMGLGMIMWSVVGCMESYQRQQQETQQALPLPLHDDAVLPTLSM